MNRPGRFGPGPKYAVPDQGRLKRAPGYSFSRTRRAVSLTQTPEQHYENPNYPDTDLSKVSNSIYSTSGRATFGSEERLLSGTNVKSVSPGPVYSYEARIGRSVPRWTMSGRKLDKGRVLDLSTSTTVRVGPGRYSPETWEKSKYKAQYSFPRSKRELPIPQPASQNQTYDPTAES
jgi:hypothetical protein